MNKVEYDLSVLTWEERCLYDTRPMYLSAEGKRKRSKLIYDKLGGREKKAKYDAQPEMVEKRLAYAAKEENKAKKRAHMVIYSQKPEVKARYIQKRKL